MKNRSVSARVLVALAVTLLLTSGAPTASAIAATCAGDTYKGQLYCTSTISAVKASTPPQGTPVVLHGVSVTAKTARTVTIAGLEVAPCPRAISAERALPRRSSP